MNIFKITEEEKRRILNSHKSASIVKEQTNGGINFKPKTPQELAQGLSTVTAPATQAAPVTQQKFEFKTDPNLNLNPDAIQLKQQTPQELAKSVASATPAPSTVAVKGNPMIAKLQQTLIDKFKVNLGNTGPNKNGVDGYMGMNTANGIKKALEILKTTPDAEVTDKTDTTQQKKFEFKTDPNINPNNSGIKLQQQTPQELAKGVQMAAVKK